MSVTTAGSGGGVEALAEHQLEGVGHALAMLEHAVPGAEGVDEDQMRGVLLADDDFGEALKRGAQALEPVIGRAVGARDALRGHRRDHVVGR